MREKQSRPERRPERRKQKHAEQGRRQKLHVLEVNKFYPPHVGGIETVVAQRATWLADCAETEVRVLVCQEQGAGSKEQLSDSLELVRCGSLGVLASCPVSLDFFIKFRKYAKWADVIEFHTPFPPGDIACLVSGCRCRVVISWHSDIIRQKRFLKYYQPFLHKFLQRADCILVATQGHIESSAFLPAYREKCRILPYPVVIPAYDAVSPQPVLREKLYSRNHVKLLFAGRFVYYKGVDVLIRAFARTRNCELFLCGSGVLEPQLRQMAENLPVHFLGRLSDAALKSAFADCDIFILPSVENAEAFGIVQLEAMAYGKPVINTSLPTGVPYVSIHGETGLTVEPGNVQALAEAIQKLVDAPALRQQYGENARKRVEACYDSEAIMQEYRQILTGA